MAGQQVNTATTASDLFAGDLEQQERFSGLSGLTATSATAKKSTKAKPPKIIWPEKFKRAKKLPGDIEEQPF